MERQNKKIDEFLEGAGTVAIAGHVNPDGDCIGACMGLWLYLRDNFPGIKATVYLESYRDVFSYIEGLSGSRSSCGTDEEVDLLILADISSKERVGAASPLLGRAKKILCFDHHITNRGTYTWFFNDPGASSACEVILGFLDPELISPACATALYTGIVSDTGVFQYSCTSPDTMRAAAALMEKGIPFSEIIDLAYFQKTYAQNRVLGKVLFESRLLLGGELVWGEMDLAGREEFGVEAKDMDGIVSELRNTIGARIAVFVYETGKDVWKASFRSKSDLDVSRVAQEFGGGGHSRAAGCTVEGSLDEVGEKIVRAFEKLIAGTP